MPRLQHNFATTVFCLAITAIWPRHTQTTSMRINTYGAKEWWQNFSFQARLYPTLVEERPVRFCDFRKPSKNNSEGKGAENSTGNRKTKWKKRVTKHARGGKMCERSAGRGGWKRGRKADEEVLYVTVPGRVNLATLQVSGLLGVNY